MTSSYPSVNSQSVSRIHVWNRSCVSCQPIPLCIVSYNPIFRRFVFVFCLVKQPVQILTSSTRHAVYYQFFTSPAGRWLLLLLGKKHWRHLSPMPGQPLARFALLSLQVRSIQHITFFDLNLFQTVELPKSIQNLQPTFKPPPSDSLIAVPLSLDRLRSASCLIIHLLK